MFSFPPDPFTQFLHMSARPLPQAAKFVIIPRKNAWASGFNFDTTHSQPIVGYHWGGATEGVHYPLPKFLGVFLDLSATACLWGIHVWSPVVPFGVHLGPALCHKKTFKGNSCSQGPKAGSEEASGEGTDQSGSRPGPKAQASPAFPIFLLPN